MKLGLDSSGDNASTGVSTVAIASDHGGYNLKEFLPPTSHEVMEKE